MGTTINRKKLNWKNIEKLPTTNDMLDSLYGKEGTPERAPSNPALALAAALPYSASLGASTGQTPAQAPQEMQASASMTYFPSPSVMQFVGHSSTQAPQEM